MGQHGLDHFRQRDQTQQVGHGDAGLAHCLGHLLLGELEFLLQTLQRNRFFDRVEVFTLNILDQRHGDRGFIRHVAHHRRDSLLAGLLAGTPAALPGDNLKAATANGAHHDGLHHALSLDRVGQFFQGLGVHVPTWLVFAALDQVQRQVLQLALVGLHRLFFKRCDGRTTQQCIQSTSETSFLDGHGDSLSWLGCSGA